MPESQALEYVHDNSSMSKYNKARRQAHRQFYGHALVGILASGTAAALADAGEAGADSNETAAAKVSSGGVGGLCMFLQYKM